MDGRLRTAIFASAFVGFSACASEPSGGGSGSAAGGTQESPATGEGTVACEERSLASRQTGFFVDISAPSGITKDNFVPNPTTPIPINDHSRLAFVDLDGDGFDDIVAHSLYPNPQKGIPFEHLVFLSNGDKTFRPFSDESGLRAVQAGFFVFADVDNDGDQDLFAGLDIALPGETSAIYLNDGKGHFTRRASSGVEAAKRAAAATFADFDGDAIVDLYVGNGGSSSALADQLFLGVGDGTFRDASARLRSAPSQPTNGVVACDYDGDGDTDIVVSHYGVSIANGWQTLWENDGEGGFVDVGEARGYHALPTGNPYLASTGHGVAIQPGDPGAYVGSNGFGVDCADVDGDGVLDVWHAAISHPVDADLSRKWSDPSQLFLGKATESGHTLESVTLDRGIPFNEGDIDAAIADYDNDGRPDLFVTRDKKYEGSYTNDDQRAFLGVLHQKVDGHFESLGKDSGAGVKAGQNLALSDIDHDGDLDLLVGGRDNGGAGRANFLFENTLGSENAWLAIRLRGDGRDVNRDALGARVVLTAGKMKLVREVKSARGTYASADTRVLHFGLGGLASAGCLGAEIRWPNGATQRLDAAALQLNRYVTVDYAP